MDQAAIGRKSRVPPLADRGPVNVERFACTVCGKCCTRGPEMELSEATALADVFATRLLFRIQAIPNDLKTQGVQNWLASDSSSAAAAQAIDDAHAHATLFAAAREKLGDGWTRYVMISALPVYMQAGRCPALADDKCTIYERRPLSCRTTPFHYSRPTATLAAQLKRFVATPGFQCDTGPDAPAILKGGRIADETLKKTRRDAAALHRTEAAWRKAIIGRVKGPDADASGLPTYRSIFLNSQEKRATSVSMAAAWAVARKAGVMSAEDVGKACAAQAKLLNAEIALAGGSQAAQMFRDMLADCEAAAS